MKKKLLALALAISFGISGTAWAGPFADVPAQHWSYGAVNQLAKAGIIEGYSDGMFHGDKTITRYEMAIVVAKALEHSDKADSANKALLDKLSVEYAQELKTLGVRVTNLENKVDNLEDQVGKVKFTGETRFRYDHVSGQDLKNSQSYIDLWANARINKDWTAKAEFESAHNGDGTEQDTSQKTTRIFAEGSAFGGTLTIGKFNPFSMYGLVIDDNMTGVQFKFGNALKTRVAFGKLNASKLGSYGQVNDPDAAAFTPDDVNGSSYAAIELMYPASKASNVRAAYHRVNLPSDVTDRFSGLDSTVNYWEYGFDTAFAKDWKFFATGSQSNIDLQNQDNKGYLAQIQYKAADITKVGSYDVFVNYRKIPVLSQIDATWDYSRGIKGSQIGIEYVPMANSKITAFYLDGKLVDDDSKVDVFRAQLQLFF